MSWDTLAWARRQRTGSPGRKAVLMVLAEHADEADSCFPGQATIADATEQSVRTVRGQLADLEGAGIIRREHRPSANGGRLTDRYYLLRPPAESAPNPPGLAAAATGVSGNTEGGYRQPVAAKQPLLEQPPLEPTTSRDDGPDHLFAQFWNAYPRKSAKPTARAAWNRAVKRADGRLLVERAAAYASDPNLPEPQFVPHPATWLNGDRWADGPLPPRAKGNGTARNTARVDTNRDAPSGRVTDL